MALDNDNEVTFKLTPSEDPYFEMPREEPFPFEKNKNN